MPIYEYQCKKCNTCFEKLVFVGDDESVHCPKCGTGQVKKQMSSVSFMGGGIGGACSKSDAGGFS